MVLLGQGEHVLGVVQAGEDPGGLLLPGLGGVLRDRPHLTAERGDQALARPADGEGGHAPVQVLGLVHRGDAPGAVDHHGRPARDELVVDVGLGPVQHRPRHGPALDQVAPELEGLRGLRGVQPCLVPAVGPQEGHELPGALEGGVGVHRHAVAARAGELGSGLLQLVPGLRYGDTGLGEHVLVVEEGDRADRGRQPVQLALVGARRPDALGVAVGVDAVPVQRGQRARLRYLLQVGVVEHQQIGQGPRRRLPEHLGDE